MHTHLIISTSESLTDEYIADLVKKSDAEEITHDIQKIADVRELEKLARRLEGRKPAFVLKNVDNASEEAMNALLKILEEPPEGTLFFLTARNELKVLDTIRSRSNSIRLNSKKQISERTNEFWEKGFGERLNIISTIKKREDALSFTEEIILILETKVKDKSDLFHALECAHDTYKNLQANGNINLQLSNLVIKLDNIHDDA